MACSHLVQGGHLRIAPCAINCQLLAASSVSWDAVSFSITLIFLVNSLDDREKRVLASLATMALVPRFATRSGEFCFKLQVPVSDQNEGKCDLGR